ncbi:MAG: pyridoxamine 5'-phosphate oxidase family protein [Anaerolineae bacterium]|nr:pyridoxamine 5'-phosphate oxidase family protein [Anaerolineae bacterium]
MGKVFDHIPEDQIEFIAEQHMFFVATAPLSEDGHINLSPKGQDCFRVLSPNRVAYLDLTGSGNETSAHLAENQRITFMFCAFKGAPNILRLYGKGTTVLPGSAEWDELFPHFTELLGMRQIIVAEIDRVHTSCGYAVPFMDFRAERETLTKYWEKKGIETLPDYQQKKNKVSIDGLPAPLAALYEDEKR